MKLAASIVGGVVLLCALWVGIATLATGSSSPGKWFGSERVIEVRRAGNAFTLIGHCEGGGCSELDTELNNLMTRKAGRVCAEHGLPTQRVVKIGDQRYVVVCEVAA